MYERSSFSTSSAARNFFLFFCYSNRCMEISYCCSICIFTLEKHLSLFRCKILHVYSNTHLYNLKIKEIKEHLTTQHCIIQFLKSDKDKESITLLRNSLQYLIKLTDYKMIAILSTIHKLLFVLKHLIYSVHIS